MVVDNKQPSQPEDSSPPLAGADCFIERQFPVARVSMESFKERSAKQSQTLTGLGKWWGRKPLVLVRATLLGLLLPVSDDPVKDREIFLSLLTMDEEGLWRRKNKSISQARLLQELSTVSPGLKKNFIDTNSESGLPRLRRLSRHERETLQRLVFERMNYTEKLSYCQRPEHLSGPTQDNWRTINEHLGTDATTLPELVTQLGEKRFGHQPQVGDSFCGAGSIPFEAGRIGCDAYASDLSPVAAVLAWAGINVVGGDQSLATNISTIQKKIYREVDQTITDWKIEHNEQGWRADIYLYCVEVRDPETGRIVPLLPSRVVSKKYNAIANLVLNEEDNRYDVEIVSGVSEAELKDAAKNGTIADNRICAPGSNAPTPIETLRRAMRMWENQDIAPHPNDVFQERLYCVRWILPDLEEALCIEQVPKHHCRDRYERRWGAKVTTIVENLLPLLPTEERSHIRAVRRMNWKPDAEALLNAKEKIEACVGESGSEEQRKLARELVRVREALPEQVIEITRISKSMPSHIYLAPTETDFDRETKTIALLSERFSLWQTDGLLPTRRIEHGYNTTQPIRERGWTHWHHLFAPRQLLLNGLLLETLWQQQCDATTRVACLVNFSRCADYNARLSRWHPRTIGDKTEQVFSNQALNTMWNFAVRGTLAISSSFFSTLSIEPISGTCEVYPLDARTVTHVNDIWITDPPYADAVNYHELGEFFLAWYEKHLPKLFPDWYTDSKRALAVKADDPIQFKQSMVACYSRLVEYMPDDGLQVVMFTHQDAAVWADLTMILWAAGLRVTAAWCIATETDSALKQGNYVQGTVLLVCRKRIEGEPVFLDEINHRVESEVRRQLDEMLELEDASEPNFADADYQLAAYAAALRVLTERPIEEIDPQREIARVRQRGEVNPVETLIRNAVKIACDHLVPEGIDREMWKSFSPMERFYLKGLEVETHGERRSGVYQELARGFGANSYADLLASSRANEARLKTASEFGRRMLTGEEFGASLVRQILFGVYQILQSEEVASGLNWLKTEVVDYWSLRDKLLHVLEYLTKLDKIADMEHWRKDAEAAHLLAGAVRNDHV